METPDPHYNVSNFQTPMAPKKLTPDVSPWISLKDKLDQALMFVDLTPAENACFKRLFPPEFDLWRPILMDTHEYPVAQNPSPDFSLSPELQSEDELGCLLEHLPSLPAPWNSPLLVRPTPRTPSCSSLVGSCEESPVYYDMFP